jgi:hypothetical protein
MTNHLAPGGVLVIAPFFPPAAWVVGQPHALFVDQPDLKLVRMNVSDIDASGTLAILDFHYLVGTPEGVEHFTERHELGLFTDEEYRAAFTQADLVVSYDAEGLIGRGLYIGSASMGAASSMS